jgi:hypothetical protein
MNQLAIDLRVRRNDPHTSREAAVRVNEFSAAHYTRILCGIDPIDGSTIYDLEFDGVIDHVAAARRLSELEKAGKVYWQGERKGPSGRNCRVWWVV